MVFNVQKTYVPYTAAVVFVYNEQRENEYRIWLSFVSEVLIIITQSTSTTAQFSILNWLNSGLFFDIKGFDIQCQNAMIQCSLQTCCHSVILTKHRHVEVNCKAAYNFLVRAFSFLFRLIFSGLKAMRFLAELLVRYFRLGLTFLRTIRFSAKLLRFIQTTLSCQLRCVSNIQISPTNYLTTAMFFRHYLKSAQFLMNDRILTKNPRFSLIVNL